MTRDPHKAENGASPKALRLLLVDDEPPLLRAVTDVLATAGYAVEPFTNPRAALQRLSETHFDLVITDVRMPEIDGLEFARLVSAGPQRIPVVVLTGYPSTSTAVEALRSAAVDYLVKPVSAGELVDRVRAAIERSGRTATTTSIRDGLEGLTAKMQTLAATGGGVGRAARSGRTSSGRRSRRSGPDAASITMPGASLTLRERDVLDHLAQGHRLVEISKELGISCHTGRNHLKAIFRKFHVSSQVELMSRILLASPNTDEHPEPSAPRRPRRSSRRPRTPPQGA